MNNALSIRLYLPFEYCVAGNMEATTVMSEEEAKKLGTYAHVNY
jgi:hypothetical protein